MPPRGDAFWRVRRAPWFHESATATKGEPVFEVETHKTRVAVEGLNSDVLVERFVEEGGDSPSPGTRSPSSATRPTAD